MEGRRATLRAHLLADIKAAALQELRRSGAAALTLREVARTAGISPAGLYRYVDGRDGLLELLISDGFESFGATIEAAVAAAGDDLTARLDAIALSYRRWALDNPDQFGLILGNPIPGFIARADGPTVSSVDRFAEPMIRVVASAYASVRSDEVRVDETMLQPSLPDLREGVGPESFVGLLIRGWSRIHGLVSLEVYGHLTWSNAEVERLLKAEIRSFMTEIGRHQVR